MDRLRVQEAVGFMEGGLWEASHRVGGSEGREGHGGLGSPAYDAGEDAGRVELVIGPAWWAGACERKERQRLGEQARGGVA